MIVSAYPFPPFLGDDPIKLFTSAVVRKAPRSLGAHVKSLNYLDAIVAKQQAGALGMHDAVMLDSLGAVAECTGANLFIVVGDTLVTPTTRAALPGITRRTVLEIAAEEGIDGERARHLAGRAALRRRRVRLRLGRGRSCRSAPSTAARSSQPHHPIITRIQDAYKARTRAADVPDGALHCRPMRLFVTVLALFALLAPQAAQAKERGVREHVRQARCAHPRHRG